MEKLNNIPKEGKWGDIADLLNNNLGKIEQKMSSLNLSYNNSKGFFPTYEELVAKHPTPSEGEWAIVNGVIYYAKQSNEAFVWQQGTKVSMDVDLSDYLKKNGQATDLMFGDDTLANVINSKNLRIMPFQGFVEDADILPMGYGGSDYEVYYIIEQNMFAARVGKQFFYVWGDLSYNSDSEYNINGIARADVIFVDSDNAMWRVVDGNIRRISNGRKWYTKNAQVNRAVKELFITNTQNTFDVVKKYYIQSITKNQGLLSNTTIIEIADGDSDTVLARYETTATPPSTVRVNGTGFVAFFVIDWDEVGASNDWFTDFGTERAYLTDWVLKPDFSPSLYSYLMYKNIIRPASLE